MSITIDQDDLGSGNNPNRRQHRLKKQREDVAKILKKVQEAAKTNADENLNKTIDLGLIQSRTSKGLAQLFNNEPATWELLFPLEFYRQIYRLNNWPISDESL